MLKYEALPRELEFFSSRVNEIENKISRLKIKSRGLLCLGRNKLEVLKSRDLVFRFEISKPRDFKNLEFFLEIDLTKYFWKFILQKGISRKLILEISFSSLLLLDLSHQRDSTVPLLSKNTITFERDAFSPPRHATLHSKIRRYVNRFFKL